MSNITSETPQPAMTNLTATLKCMGQLVNESQAKPILLLVDDFYDGTVPVMPEISGLTGRGGRENGPLADSGKYDFEAIIKRSISPKKIVIPYTPPIGLIQQEDKYGMLPPVYVQDLARLYKAAAVIRVKGVYTQNDSSDYINLGDAGGGKIKGGQGETNVEYGISKASKSLSLVVYLGDAISNTVGAATTLTLNTYTESDKFSIGLGYGEGSMSFATQARLREGLHGAQRTLIEAAALWTLKGLYQQLNFSGCFAAQGPSPDATVAAYQKWLELDEHERIKYLKLMLHELNYYSGKIDTTYDIALQSAIAAYEAKFEHDMLIPHTRNNLGDLFIQLYLKIDAKKIEKLFKQNNALL